MYHSSLTGNGLMVAGHAYKDCGFGALMCLLGLCQNNSFPGDCVLSFVWKERDRGAQSPAQRDGLLLEVELVVVQPL